MRTKQGEKLRDFLPVCPDAEMQLMAVPLNEGGDFSLPVVHYVGDDGGEEAEQHDRRAGIHHRVQKLPRVWGERQRLLQILSHKEEREKQGLRQKVIINTVSKNNQRARMSPAH